MEITLSKTLPPYPTFVEGIRRASDRGYTLDAAQTATALKNALRYILRIFVQHYQTPYIIIYRFLKTFHQQLKALFTVGFIYLSNLVFVYHQFIRVLLVRKEKWEEVK